MCYPTRILYNFCSINTISSPITTLNCLNPPFKPYYGLDPAEVEWRAKIKSILNCALPTTMTIWWVKDGGICRVPAAGIWSFDKYSHVPVGDSGRRWLYGWVHCCCSCYYLPNKRMAIRVVFLPRPPPPSHLLCCQPSSFVDDADIRYEKYEATAITIVAPVTKGNHQHPILDLPCRKALMRGHWRTIPVHTFI